MNQFFKHNTKASFVVSLFHHECGEVFRMSLMIWCSALYALAELLFTLYKGFYISSVFYGILLLTCVAASYLVYTKKSPLKLRSFLIAATIVLAASLYLEGMAAGGYLYYLALLTAIPIVSGIYDLPQTTARFFLISVIFFCAVALVSPYQSSFHGAYTITDKDYRHWLTLKLLVAVASCLFNLYITIIISGNNKLALQNEQSYSSIVFNTSAEAYLIIRDDIITDYNQRAIALFELANVNGFKHLSYTRWLHRHLVISNADAEKIINEKPAAWEGELKFATITGEEFYGHVTLMPFEYNGASYTKMSIRDISSLKLVENELRLSREKAENAATSKARFLSSMSHELRTPLNGIIGTANLLLHEKGLGQEIVNHIDVLKYSSEHMLGIINDILDFSKIEAGKMTMNISVFSLKLYLDKIYRQFQPQFAQKKLSFVTVVDPALDEVHIRGDELKLAQVLQNLLSNALKYTNAGEVRLQASMTRHTGQQTEILFEVIDTGIGIPPEKTDTIFDGFTQICTASGQLHKGGTGLGLTISKKLVTLFGSELQVESTVDKGSRFFFAATFDIDTTVRAPYVTANVHVRAENLLRGLRVLLVEDNTINMKIAKGFLRKWNVSIKEAGNGIEALELIKHHTFDIILMDLDMPDMDGYTATGILRQKGINIPILAFTAALVDDLQVKLQQSGFDGCILKPFKPNDLYAKIEACVKANVTFV